ncbi:hypothetical protein LPB41_04715 [Thalassospira sp. MA62]|nr:hypothetical protein [Thalassospira sp. MA62]
MMKRILGTLCVIAGLVSLGGAASAAGCTQSSNYSPEGGLSGWPTRVANSSNNALRAAYAAGTCVYLKGAHTGGTIPVGANGNLHVTVAISSGGKVCHVFRKVSTAPAGSYFPTTCI